VSHLHKFSPAFTRREYELFEGWDEGVVEQLQRLLRTGVLDKIGVAVRVLEVMLAEAEQSHRYNGYIAVCWQASVRTLLCARSRNDFTGGCWQRRCHAASIS
jgi:hypothetical protein